MQPFVPTAMRGIRPYFPRFLSFFSRSLLALRRIKFDSALVGKFRVKSLVSCQKSHCTSHLQNSVGDFPHRTTYRRGCIHSEKIVRVVVRIVVVGRVGLCRRCS